MTTSNITDEMIDNVLCAAFEGGITYWCSQIYHQGNFPGDAEYGHQVVTRGQHVTLFNMFDDQDNPTITRDTMAIGIQKEAERQGMTVEAWYENHDASDADNAVQMAAFGEVIYG